MKQHHLASSITPPQSPEEYEALRESIRSHGLMHPIILFEDSILDGWHRFKACQELKIEPRFETFQSNGTSPLDVLIANSLARRNLTPTQRACLAVETQQAMADEYRKSKLGNPRLKKGDTHEKSHVKCANMFGVNCTYVSNAITLRKRDPKLFEKCLRGEIGMRKAIKTVRKEKTYNSMSDKEVRKVLQEAEPPIDFPNCYDSCEKVLEYSRQFCEKGWAWTGVFANGKYSIKYYPNKDNNLNKDPGCVPSLKNAMVTALREALKM